MAAKKSAGTSNVKTYKNRGKVTRKGIIAKTKQSKNKRSKNYKKPYRGQGR